MARATRSTRVVLPDEVKGRLLEAPHRALVSPFKRLGLQGLKGIAQILLAALATEEQLLLIGSHGTAKNLLLPRVSAALKLEFRHYNVSRLNFDDLVRLPLPDKVWRLKAVVTGQTSTVSRDVAPLPNFSKTLRTRKISAQQLLLRRGTSTR
ncbi:MAG: hypothetical protein Q8L77_06350 [Nitrospirota bacterium]|nr:hypothetical protein [Nitrospirota bacterium]